MLLVRWLRSFLFAFVFAKAKLSFVSGKTIDYVKETSLGRGKSRTLMIQKVHVKLVAARVFTRRAIFLHVKLTPFCVPTHMSFKCLFHCVVAIESMFAC